AHLETSTCSKTFNETMHRRSQTVRFDLWRVQQVCEGAQLARGLFQASLDVLAELVRLPVQGSSSPQAHHVQADGSQVLHRPALQLPRDAATLLILHGQ